MIIEASLLPDLPGLPQLPLGAGVPIPRLRSQHWDGTRDLSTQPCHGESGDCLAAACFSAREASPACGRDAPVSGTVWRHPVLIGLARLGAGSTLEHQHAPTAGLAELPRRLLSSASAATTPARSLSSAPPARLHGVVTGPLLFLLLLLLLPPLRLRVLVRGPILRRPLHGRPGSRPLGSGTAATAPGPQKAPGAQRLLLEVPRSPRRRQATFHGLVRRVAADQAGAALDDVRGL
jgi:hypothetical protein